MSELYDIQLSGALLEGSAEKMRTIDGSWEEDD